MIIWGITALGHDGAITVLRDGEIVFAAHSERYSRIKNDPYLNNEIVEEALTYGEPDEIVWYEKPWLKKTRQAWAGQWKEVFGKDTLPKPYLKKFFEKVPKISYVRHHEAHAAAGAFTSPFEDAIVMVMDAVGEWDCISMWLYQYPNKLKLLHTESYPNSLGLLYSAFTQRVGLKPNEEEYILMGMAAFGKPYHARKIEADFFNPEKLTQLKINPHIGIGDYIPSAKDVDLAASIQEVIHRRVTKWFRQAMALTGNRVRNFVYGGGVALNCVANSYVAELVDSLWIMPCPGDAGNSLGAALLKYNHAVEWNGPYLGTNISGEYPIIEPIKAMLRGEVIGIANGRAEFGPRALGNRSLLADPRNPNVKDKVNEVKQRQKFRPFAPAILSTDCENEFSLPIDQSPYMQFTGYAKNPTRYPGIIHVDGSSRVQTVSPEDNIGFYQLLAEWKKQTGCSMLLNTSLNIKGEPLVNTREDADRFEQKHNIKVYS
tara:strand:+ start:279 stop:1742 length:1464 start_codon:yes stop_codon:yes gene_type:complete